MADPAMAAATDGRATLKSTMPLLRKRSVATRVPHEEDSLLVPIA